MNSRACIIKLLLLVTILFDCCKNEVFCQIKSPDDWKQPGLFFGGGIGVAHTQIINKISQDISITQSNNKNSFLGSLEIGYFFSRHIGLTIGLNYTPYRSDFFVDSYQNHLNTVDIENDPYELRISGNDIEEIQRFDMLSIPFCVNIRIPLSKVLGTYLQTGINFFVPVRESYESDGTFTYQGYFPAYNVLLVNLPDYGFPSNLRIQSEGVPELKPWSYGFVASLGIDYLFNKRVQFIAAAYYDRSFSQVIEDSHAGEFYLTTNTEDVNSILGCANNVTLQSFGLKIGIRYYLSDYTKFKYYSRPSPKRNLREYERQRKRLLR